jgi:hypothetical protein
VPGYPIRTPSDQRSVDSSPRTIAASHVLHRLLMPRHPPCALDNLTNTHIKKSRHKHATETKDARVHCTILNDHTNRPPHPNEMQSNDRPRDNTTTPTEAGAWSSSQDPTACRRPPHTHHVTRRPDCLVFPLFSSNPLPPPTTRRTWNPGRYWGPPPPATQRTEHASVNTRDRRCPVKLLRKEVIQPHLPVRLPCYDFVPIASPTFDRSPPCGLGHGLRVLPTFVT